MRIMVTGGGGFIASHVVDRYIEDGHEVVVVDNMSSGNPENLNSNGAFYHLGIESKKLGRIFQKHKPEVVNHHAAQMDVRRSVEDPCFDAFTNILGLINILQNCVNHNVQRIIFASTGGAIYGEQERFPADEEHPTKPLSPYGVSKLSGESYLYFYKMAYGLDYVALRYSNVYGPRQNPHGEAGVVAIFTQKLLNGDQPVIYGDGLQTRDFVFVDDVVAANVAALKENKIAGAFNIGTGEETDINTVFRLLKNITGTDLMEVHGPQKSGEQRRSVIDYAKAERELKWKPRVSLEEGLKKTVDWFSQRSLSRKSYPVKFHRY